MRAAMSHRNIIPNVKMKFGNADLVSFTTAGFMHEHEIKLSRADFRADFRQKHLKHKVLSLKKPKPDYDEIYEFARYRYHRKLWDEITFPLIPNYFWFVTIDDIVEYEDIPEYAGWITIGEPYEYKYYYAKPDVTHIFFKHTTVQKKAPRLHTGKMPWFIIEPMLNNATHKYFRLSHFIEMNKLVEINKNADKETSSNSD